MPVHTCVAFFLRRFFLCQANIFRGVRPPDGLREQHEEIYGATLDSVINIGSLSGMLHEDGDNGDQSQIVQRFLKLFNGRWEKYRPEHYCVLDSSRTPCHRSAAAARQDLFEALSELIVTALLSNMKESTKKWSELPRRAALLGFLCRSQILSLIIIP